MNPPPRPDHHRDFIPRRKSDVERYAVLASLLAILVSVGIAWGTAQATVNGKVDKSVFEARRSEVDRRFIGDSVKSALYAASLDRIERKVDSTNARLSRLICSDKPSYCQ